MMTLVAGGLWFVYFVTRRLHHQQARPLLSPPDSYLSSQSITAPTRGITMDRSDIPALKAQVKKVVRQADARGDIDAGRFTLKIAKKEIGASRSPLVLCHLVLIRPNYRLMM